MYQQFLQLSDEVAAALAERRAVVALESTIIAHGMPYPRNVETARRVEAAVRQTGAVPATIAVMDGRLKAGLSDAELELIAQSGPSVAKVSRRDLPLVIVRRKLGATTVAATMIVARLADIPVFATGGIGGVHRGAAESFDISADLQELARTNVAVVTAGAKAILDLGLTLEYLETHGVPVIGYRTDEFPAFYSRESGLPVDYRIDTVKELAAMIRAKWELGLHGGVVVANPIPVNFALDREAINQAIDQAVEEAERREIRGKAITPFLLGRVEALTGGASLAANVELVLNNARLAGELAVEMVQKGL